MVLHVARPLHGLGVEIPFEFAEDLAVGLADDVGEHVQPSAVRHPEDDLGDPGVGCGVEHGVEERDRRLGALEAESLLPHVAQVEEGLEGLGGVQPAEDVPLHLWRHRLGNPLDVVLDPELLLWTLDVHVLHADRVAVGVAQDLEDLRQGEDLAPRQAEGVEGAVEIVRPDPVLLGVEVGADLAWFGLERVEPRDEVAAHPVHVDERPDHQLLFQLVAVWFGRRTALRPTERFARDPEGGEHLVVEVVLADEEFADALQEQAGLRPLDDPVVVGRRQRHDLADAEGAQGLWRAGLELDRVVESADADDGTLAAHQPRHRLGRAERAGVRDRHRSAGEVLDDELAGPRPADELLVGVDEAGEVQGVRVLDHRDDERARPVGTLEVDGEAETDVRAADDPGRAHPVGVFDVARVQRRDRADGTHDRPPDEVGEAHLGTRRLPQHLVEERAIRLEHLRRDRAHARRRRHREARHHVLGDPAARAPQERDGVLVRGCPGGRRRPASRA